MTITHYRGYSICQREFGPLRLLKWVENGDFVIIKKNSDFTPGATFRTAEDAKRVIESVKMSMSASGSAFYLSDSIWKNGRVVARTDCYSVRLHVLKVP
jgi:hypothetical protein